MTEVHLKNTSQFNDEQLIELYRRMWIVRFFDEKVDYFFAKGMIHGTTHLAVGQEATAVGSGAVLRKSDWITATHRGHGQTIGKGTNVNYMMAELFGRVTGTNKGKGGSMHIAELSDGNLGANGIVGGGYPIAVGAALTSKMKQTDDVVLCYAGDGSTNEGSFHESLNLAAMWNLPVIFFIENNQYGMSGSIKEVTKIEHLSQRASSYGFDGITIDGNNLLEVMEATQKAVDKARSGGGPTLIEAITYRWKGHSKSDAKKYRTKEEEQYWRKEKDPIKLAEKQFIEAGVFTKEIAKEVKDQAKKIVEDAVTFAQESPKPSPEALMRDVLAD